MYDAPCDGSLNCIDDVDHMRRMVEEMEFQRQLNEALRRAEKINQRLNAIIDILRRR